GRKKEKKERLFICAVIFLISAITIGCGGYVDNNGNIFESSEAERDSIFYQNKELTQFDVDVYRYFKNYDREYGDIISFTQEVREGKIRLIFITGEDSVITPWDIVDLRVNEEDGTMEFEIVAENKYGKVNLKEGDILYGWVDRYKIRSGDKLPPQYIRWYNFTAKIEKVEEDKSMNILLVKAKQESIWNYIEKITWDNLFIDWGAVIEESLKSAFDLNSPTPPDFKIIRVSSPLEAKSYLETKSFEERRRIFIKFTGEEKECIDFIWDFWNKQKQNNDKTEIELAKEKVPDQFRERVIPDKEIFCLPIRDDRIYTKRLTIQSVSVYPHLPDSKTIKLNIEGKIIFSVKNPTTDNNNNNSCAIGTEVFRVELNPEFYILARFNRKLLKCHRGKIDVINVSANRKKAVKDLEGSKTFYEVYAENNNNYWKMGLFQNYQPPADATYVSVRVPIVSGITYQYFESKHELKIGGGGKLKVSYLPDSKKFLKKFLNKILTLHSKYGNMIVVPLGTLVCPACAVSIYFTADLIIEPEIEAGFDMTLNIEGGIKEERIYEALELYNKAYFSYDIQRVRVSDEKALDASSPITSQVEFREKVKKEILDMVKEKGVSLEKIVPEGRAKSYSFYWKGEENSSPITIKKFHLKSEGGIGLKVIVAPQIYFLIGFSDLAGKLFFAGAGAGGGVGIGGYGKFHAGMELLIENNEVKTDSVNLAKFTLGFSVRPFLCLPVIYAGWKPDNIIESIEKYYEGVYEWHGLCLTASDNTLANYLTRGWEVIISGTGGPRIGEITNLHSLKAIVNAIGSTLREKVERPHF
ncbi:MAG: hypothetical protein ACO2PO_23525, partial [Candidatus Calescibacterium sp.]